MSKKTVCHVTDNLKKFAVYNPSKYSLGIKSIFKGDTDGELPAGLLGQPPELHETTCSDEIVVASGLGGVSKLGKPGGQTKFLSFF